jgi:hypothetical protein
MNLEKFDDVKEREVLKNELEVLFNDIENEGEFRVIFRIVI